MSQSRVLPHFLGLVPGTIAHSGGSTDSNPDAITASQTVLKELFKRRRDEHYERAELEASTTREQGLFVDESTLWIERPTAETDSANSIIQQEGGEGRGLLFADTALGQLTDSVSSMAMYLENKIGYPHLKKVLGGMSSLGRQDEEEGEEEEEEEEDKVSGEGGTRRREGEGSVDAKELSEGEGSGEEGDEEDSLCSEDMIWFGTGTGGSLISTPSSSSEGIASPTDPLPQDGSMSPEKRSSYREQISHNIKRRMEYRESVLLQFSGLNEDERDDQRERASLPLSPVPSTPSSPHQKASPSAPILSTPSSIFKRLNDSLMSLLQMVSSSSSSSESFTHSIEIVPIAILALVVYLVSGTRRGDGGEGEEEQQQTAHSL
jgi:hypothetical protein